MRTRETAASLVRAMEEFEVIDCHEHIGPEEIRTRHEVDAFDMMISYPRLDLLAAGMPSQEFERVRDKRLPLEQRWAILKPFWEQIRWGSYARVVRLAIRKFYGFDGLDNDTYRPLSEAMAKANTPGIYERVLRDACRIRTALTQCGTTQTGTPLLTPTVAAGYRFSQTDPFPYQLLVTREQLVSPTWLPDGEIADLDAYVEAFGEYLTRSKAEGAVALKIAAIRTGAPDRSEAESACARLLSGEPRLPGVNPLQDYVLDRMVGIAAELDLVVAVHTGYWGDFRNVDPLNLIPLLQRHPAARFDVYHLGYPWPRQALMLGKRFPNVWLNLCWMHAVSPRCTAAMLEEAVDTVPMNKILAFGGDYNAFSVEQVYGHLVLARRNIARAFAAQIEEGRMSEADAVELSRKWFWHNPRELYQLQV